MPYIRDKVTGQTIFVPDTPQSIPVGPQDNSFPLKAKQVQTGIQAQQSNMANDAVGRQRTQVQTQGDALSNQVTARGITQAPISKEDQAFINSIRKKQGDIPGTLKDISAAELAIRNFGSKPGRGTLYSMAVPEDNDWVLTAALKNGIAGMAPNEFTPKRKEDYQTIVGLQNQAVLNTQKDQNGVQTESDAARMKLASISPNKDVVPNLKITQEQKYDLMMKQALPGFYENWANKLGSTHALNRQGKSADQVWAEEYRKGYEAMRRSPYYPGNRKGVASAPRKSKVINFNDWKD